MTKQATILHVDMDSFFVSVELLDRPQLRGKPVAVAHDSARSVVTSASYEARRYGVRSAMPTSHAKQLCPNLILVPPTMAKYRAASQQIMKIFTEISPYVEPLSIDEAFIDITGVQKLLGSPTEIGQRLRKRLKSECGLPASVGIAKNKFVAKLASAKAKPDGLLIIEPAETISFLHSLPITDMWGVGKATEKVLRSRGLHKIADIANEPLESLQMLVGKAIGTKLHNLSHGRDDRSVEIDTKEKSVGHEDTFRINLVQQTDIEKELLRLSWRTASRLRDKGITARTVAIKVRWSNFETVTRSRTLAEPSNSSERFYAVARELFDSLEAWGRPVRLLGVRAEQLLEGEGSILSLWSEDEEYSAVDKAVDQVRGKYGSFELKPATLLEKPELRD